MSNSFVPGLLRFKTGDATIPESAGQRYIIHICNMSGGWGAGFVNAISKRWKKPEQEYRQWFRSQTNFKMGEIQLVQVQSDTVVVNMLAQAFLRKNEADPIAVDYQALGQCLDKVAAHIKREGGSVHAPRIGTGLAGGSWDEIEKLIVEKLIKQGVNVTIYDLPVKPPATFGKTFTRAKS